MKSHSIAAYFGISALLSLGFTTATPSVIVEGTIVSSDNNKPISQAHVYIIHGEEESLTDSKGFFRIESWQKLPIRVTVESKDHQTTTITVTDVKKKQTITLKHK